MAKKTKKTRKEQQTEPSQQAGDIQRQKKKAKPLQVSIMDTGDGSGLVATNAGVRIATGNTPMNNDVEVMMVRTGNDVPAGLVGGGGAPGGTSGGSGGGGRQPAATGGTDTRTTATSSRTEIATDTETQQPRHPPPAPNTPARQPAATGATVNGQPVNIIVPRENKPKQLKILKYKGVDDPTPVTTWLRSIQNEIKRQSSTLGVTWLQHQLFLEVAANFEGEALRWFGTIAGTIAEEDQTFDNLTRLLRAKYTVQRSTPEVVARLNGRRQMTGERLVEYAQVLREIVADRGIGEEWLIDAFLCGMQNEQSAAAVRGHYPQTLDEAVQIAVFQVGEYGEGYRVGLEASIARQQARATSSGTTPSAAVATAPATQGPAPLANNLVGNLASVVTGYESILGVPTQLTGGRQPRYDTEGRLVVTGMNAKGVPNWLEAASLIFGGYQTAVQGASAGSATNQTQQQNRTAGSDQRQQPVRVQQQQHGHRSDAGGQSGRRFGKARRVEGRTNAPTRTSGGFGSYCPPQPLLTKEDRLRNYRRWQDGQRDKTTTQHANETQARPERKRKSRPEQRQRRRRSWIGKRHAGVEIPALLPASTTRGGKRPARARLKRRSEKRKIGRYEGEDVRKNRSGRVVEIVREAPTKVRRVEARVAVKTGDGAAHNKKEHSVDNRSGVTVETNKADEGVQTYDPGPNSSATVKDSEAHSQQRHVHFRDDKWYDEQDDGRSTGADEPRRQPERRGLVACTTKQKQLTPAQLMAEVVSEMSRSDGVHARTLRMRALDTEAQQLRETEDERRKAKAEKRRARAQRRRLVKARLDRGLLAAEGNVRIAASTREDAPGDAGIGVAPGVTHESRVVMSEPTPEFREAMEWSVRACDALQHVQVRRDPLVDGFAKLAIEEAARLEDLAAGNVVGENGTRNGVAQQLVAAATGLRAIADGEWCERGDTPVQVSRARRPFEKKVRKAVAKERRDQLTQHPAVTYTEPTYIRMEDLRQNGGTQARHLTAAEAEAVGIALPHAENALEKAKNRQKARHRYDYHSGSVYEQPMLVDKTGEVQLVRVGKLRAVQAPAVDLLPTAVVEVQGTTRHIKIDTGAQYSVAGKVWATYGQKLSMVAPVDYMEGFSGVAVRVLGMWRFTFHTQYRQQMQVDALLVDSDTSDFLLGEDWMYKQGVKIDFVASEMKWYADDVKVVVPFMGIGNRQQPRAQMMKVRMIRKAKVVTQTLHNVDLAVGASNGTVGVFIPKKRKERYLLLAPTVTTVRDERIRIPIMSLMGRTTKLPSRETLGTWVPLEQDMTILEVNGELENDRVRAWLNEVLCVQREPLCNEEQLKIGEMSDDDRKLLLQLLRDYPKQLEPHQGCPPMTTLGVEHEIHTGDAPPIKVRARRHAHSEYGVIDHEVDDMLRDKVIEESNGAWGFPVVLVKKKDGSVRFCIDYRLLNAVTIKDVYPLPRIDETLESMHGSQRYTSLDLHAGYWQVPVAEKDRDKTGFVTRRGLFRFVRMPFGLANAPGTFQRMMDAVLRGLTWQCCLVYLDDVIIFSKGGVPRHIVELAAVLERLKQAGLSLKASKCSFAATRLEYLGHELDEKGVRPMESLVKSVLEFPVPKDEKDVKRFVHLAGFYRRFIPEFGTKAAPMTKLLRKATEWEWGPEQQASFEQLKAELTTRPLLIYPDFTKPFKLVTDASVTDLSAALMQNHGKGAQPIAYASKVNSPTVAKYGITDLECAAVVWAIKLFRPYLYGRRFELVTDHSALSWLMKSKDLTGRLHRWSLQLQEYDFTIVYRPGSTNVVADALSRAPVRQVSEAAAPVDSQNTDNQLEARAAGTGQMTDREIREHQQNDAQTERLKAAGRYGTQRIVDVQGVVCIESADGQRRVVLPVALRHKVLREAHDSIFACHLRIPQTYAKVAAAYWWPDMRTTVRQWVRSCRDCGTRKARPKEVIPPLRSQGLGSVGDRWALDVAGPLPVTGRGNRYVIAAVEYATRYSVAVAVPTHTARDVARFVVERIVLVHGPMREIVMDGAPELNGRVIDELVTLLQARQTTPVPYRPALLGLVERFHRTWKDMVAMYVAESQTDWDEWLPCAVYAYNGARHTTTGFTPNELFMGRRLRAPNELLRVNGVSQIGQWAEYHRNLIRHMRVATEIAHRAAAQDQARREKYYNQRTRATTRFKVGDLVWILKPPRGRGVTKLAHRWVGPAKIVEDIGYDNWRLVRHDNGDTMATHCSFLTSYHSPEGLLNEIAQRTVTELADEDEDDLTEIWEGSLVEPEGGTSSGIAVIGAEAQQPATEGQHDETVSAGQAGPVDVSPRETTVAEQLAARQPVRRVERRHKGGAEAADLLDTRTGAEVVTGSDGHVALEADEQAPTAENAVSPGQGDETRARGADTSIRPSTAPEERLAVTDEEATVGLAAVSGENSASGTTSMWPGIAGKRRLPTTQDPVKKRPRSEQTRDGGVSIVPSDEAQQRRQLEARAARDERATRRSARRDQQEVTATTTTSTDADSGVHGTGTPSISTAAEDSTREQPHDEAAARDDERRPLGAEPQLDVPEESQTERRNDGGLGQARKVGDAGGAVQALRGRGRPRKQAPQPDLSKADVYGIIVELGRRRTRNRAGRYELEYQVQYQTTENGPRERRWIGIQEYEALLDSGKLEDELEGEGE